MVAFLVYKSDACRSCKRTRDFLGGLRDKGLDVRVAFVDAMTERAKFSKVVQQVGRTTLPQIFMDGKYVGGWDDLMQAATSGRLQAYFAGGEWVEPRPGFMARLGGKVPAPSCEL